jgi:hypothetical protein
MKEVEQPSPVLVAALNHGFNGVTDAAVGFESCIPQTVESAQDVVVPKRREREPKPAFVDDFAGSDFATAADLCFARSYSSSPSSTQTVVWNEERRLLGASQFQPPSSSCSPRR